MKVKVTFERIYDSNKFYEGLDEKELSSIDFKDFKVGIIDDIYDYPEDIIDSMNFEKIE
jgi:hypothetical protein